MNAFTSYSHHNIPSNQEDTKVKVSLSKRGGYTVRARGQCRGHFGTLVDAQLWALTIAAIEPDISHAVMACGTCIEK